jgi:hypothetical protein
MAQDIKRTDMIGNQFANGNSPNKTSFKKGNVPWNKGGKLSKEHCKNLSLSHKGQVCWATGKTLSETHRKNISKGRCGKMVGLNNHMWKGGKTSLSKNLRRRIEFKQWREAVFERDDYTCMNCGIRGGDLHPHHIFQVSEYPELVYNVKNGITLCVKCHYTFHGDKLRRCS